ncbi:MAG: hypothetical protein AAGB11_16995 [Pseudomonadota bacterium]
MQKQGQDSLRQALHVIRSALNDYSSPVISTSRTGVSVHPEHLDYDLWHSDGTIDETIADTFLEDLENISPVFDEWLAQARREVSHRQVLRAERLLAGVDLASDPNEALRLATTILTLDPTNEPAARAAMKIHANRGEVGHARRIFDDLRVRLQAVDLDASGKTVAVIQSVTSQNALTAGEATHLAVRETAFSPPSEADIPLVELATAPANGSAQGYDAVFEEFFDRLVSRMIQMPEIRVRTDSTAGTLSGSEYRLLIAPAARGDSTRVVLRLSAGNGESFWSSRADLSHDATDETVDVQVDTVVTRMLPSLEEHIYRGINGEPATAYANYILARRTFLAAYPDDYMEQVMQYLHRAIELDPEFLPAIERLIMYYNTGAFMSRPGANHSAPREKAYKLAQQLLFLNSQYPNAHVRMAWCLLWQGKYQSAERSLRRAMELKPYDPHMLNVLATALVYLGHHDTAERYYNMAQDRLLHDMDFQRTDYGELHYLKREFETALSWLETPEVRTPYRTLFWRAPTYAQLGRLAEARQDVSDMIEDLRQRWRGSEPFNPEAGVEWLCHMKPYRRASDRDLLIDGFNKAGLKIHARSFPLEVR